jgi:hypothetical protein
VALGTTNVGCVNAMSRWVVTRQLKQTSVSLKRAENDLRIEKEQVHSFDDDAADAQGEYLTVGNAATRDEAFRANRHLEKSQSRVTELSSLVVKLRERQDQLLDRLGS